MGTTIKEKNEVLVVEVELPKGMDFIALTIDGVTAIAVSKEGK
jgi:hypothetical protein